jgi:hypothetical protein
MLEGEKLGTYGSLRNGILAVFSVNLLAGFVIWRRDDEEFGIDTLDEMWRSRKRHDGRCLVDLRVYSEGS